MDLRYKLRANLLALVILAAMAFETGSMAANSEETIRVTAAGSSVDVINRTNTSVSTFACTATSDADNDGNVLTVADRDYMSQYLKGCGPAPVVPYSYDLNGNGVVDTMDLRVFQDYLTFGFIVFSVYGGFPVPCPCDPIIMPYGTCCCTGTTGNVNTAGIVDLADLSALVSYLTGGGYALPCSGEANINAAGIVDLTDLSSLVSYLTGGGYALPNCR